MEHLKREIERRIAVALVEKFETEANISRISAIKCARICVEESRTVASVFGGETAKNYDIYSTNVIKEINKL